MQCIIPLPQLPSTFPQLCFTSTYQDLLIKGINNKEKCSPLQSSRKIIKAQVSEYYQVHDIILKQ